MYHRGTISHSEHRPHFQSVLQSIIKDNIKISGNVNTEFWLDATVVNNFSISKKPVPEPPGMSPWEG